MATRLVSLTVLVEDKDEYAGGQGSLPDPGETAVHLQDILADATKRDFELPWHVRRVEEAPDQGRAS
jgi:hypothetical protein